MQYKPHKAVSVSMVCVCVCVCIGSRSSSSTFDLSIKFIQEKYIYAHTLWPGTQGGTAINQALERSNVMEQQTKAF